MKSKYTFNERQEEKVTYFYIYLYLKLHLLLIEETKYHQTHKRANTTEQLINLFPTNPLLVKVLPQTQLQSCWQHLNVIIIQTTAPFFSDYA